MAMVMTNAPGGTAQQQQDADQRQKQMKKAWDAFNGVFADPLKMRVGQGVNDNVKVNHCRAPVLKGVAALFGKDVAFEIAEDAPFSQSQRDAMQLWLNKCWKFNKKSITLKKWGTNAAVCGTGFLKVVPGKPFPRIIVQDPTMVSVQSAPDDVETPVAFQVTWSGYDAQAQEQDFREVTLQAPSGQSWLIVSQHRRKGASAAESWITDKSETWPYAWPPIHWNQNLPVPNAFFGMSDIAPDIIQLNNDLNFVYSNIARILRYHAHPKTWAKGIRTEQIQVAIDETIVLANPNAQIGALEMTSDLHSSMQFAQRLEQAIEGLTQVPSITTGANVESMPKVTSGIALVILHQPLIDKTMDKQETYGDTLESLNSHLLELGGFAAGVEVTNHWQNILVKDDLMEAQVAQLIDGIGIASKQTLATRLGFDWEEEQERMQAEADEAKANLPPALQAAQASPGAVPPPLQQQQPPAQQQQGAEQNANG